MTDPGVAAALPRSEADARQVERWFYISVALVMILLSGVAFVPPLVNLSGHRVPRPLTPLVTAHAAVSVVWLLLVLIHKRLMPIAMLGALTPTPMAHVIGHWLGPQAGWIL